MALKAKVEGCCTREQRGCEDVCHDAGRMGSSGRIRRCCCSGEVVLLIALPAWECCCIGHRASPAVALTADACRGQLNMEQHADEAVCDNAQALS